MCVWFALLMCQREITRRRKAGPDGIPENPIYTMQYEYLEKSEEERAAFEKAFEEQRGETFTSTYLDVDGETILTEEQVKEKYLSDPNWTPPPLPPPKKWLTMLKARNAKYWQQFYANKAKETALQGIAQAATQLREATAAAAEDKGAKA